MSQCKELTHSELTAQFYYDADTGHLHRRKNGKQMGRPDVDGYIAINIRKRKYRGHRLIWFYVHGVWPTGVVDHINNDGLDNRIVNLRDISASENSRRQKRCAIYGGPGVKWRRNPRPHPRIQSRSV